ncbi:MAG: GNAT family N-acetyltransferase [Betaproteobacteria bacterium]
MVLVLTESGKVSGLAIMVARQLRRHGLISSRALYLNKTGDEALDEITIEYNGILSLPQQRDELTLAALDFLTANGWDEIFIDATCSVDTNQLSRHGRWNTVRRSASHAYGVDLTALRTNGASYLDSLGSNTRQQYRRAARAYETLGPLRVEVAGTPEEAVAWYGEMSRLHQAYWIAKGKSGAFSNPFLDNFHRRLIADRMRYGEIQLLRISFGERCIGYLYGFLWDGVVLNYQSGLDYNVLPERNRPGVVAHVAAIEFNSLAGARYYDFLGGDSQHKQSLSTSTVPLDWIVARRASAKFWLEDAMRATRNRLRAQRRTTPAQHQGE